jgi:hypothetical protein
LGDILERARPLTIFCSSHPLPLPNARVQVIRGGSSRQISLSRMGIADSDVMGGETLFGDFDGVVDGG